ncbi:adenylate kinase [Longispora fulva]|uniref:Adenylate kinase n=1 Tax=Longispora fulva TaxID=619741 RepID=A0A8J7GQ55_9ACTN|nr:nucleoside monophosphate kinase [Longispora fulva]MBG6141730.1 adenylate kinase [Longispora fulva]GIG59115.1 adenylate kinase [Longispora fulva]
MRLVIFGPPGSERKAIASFIAARRSVPAITWSDIIKVAVRAGTPLSVRARHHMNVGEPLPEQLLASMAHDHLTRLDATGFVLEGPPDHAARATAIDVMLAGRGTPIDRAVDLTLSDAEVLRRLSGRRLCRACGKVWHLRFAPPARSDTCDNCRGELFQRHDDSPARVALGLRTYRAAMAPALDHYRALDKLVSVDATLPTGVISSAATAGFPYPD